MNSDPVFERLQGPFRARRAVWVLGAVLLLSITVSAILSVRPLLLGRSELRQVARDGDVRHDVSLLRTTLADWQIYVEQRLGLVSPAGVKISPIDLAQGAQLITTEEAQAARVTRELAAMGLVKLSRDLASASESFQKSVVELQPLVQGASAAVATKAIGAVRSNFSNMWTLTAEAEDQVTQAAQVDLRQGTRHLDSGRTIILVVDVVFATVVLVGALVIGELARRRERDERHTTTRRTFESTLQEALDMSRDEGEVFGVLDRALPTVVPRLQVEMLVADSSRAHFHQSMRTAPREEEERSGCGVVSPENCPATTRGRTLLFRSSRALDACPYLIGRSSGECSAVCVPVSIAGKTVGVTHATAPDDAAPNDTEVRYLEVASRRVSDRLAMVRAFERSETQAQSDPLTGLLNRRSLENRVNDLQREGIQYMLAYGDLDHFKDLNDTHGHESGDQALRLFSRVMRDSVRPNDVVARYGGEEFVIVLPDCDVDAAVAVLERVREHLALALTSGRVPSFTASFGLTSSTEHATFDEALAAADKTLLEAKAAGRNRVIGTTYPGEDDHAEP